jgi:hypothetical protein
MRDFIFEVQTTGYYFKDLITQRRSKCCGAAFEYVQGIIKPDTNRWTVERICIVCYQKEQD